MDIPEYILSDLRQRRGLEANDDSQDDQIGHMSANAMFDAYCNWHGLIGWGPRLRETLSVLRAAKRGVRNAD